MNLSPRIPGQSPLFPPGPGQALLRGSGLVLAAGGLVLAALPAIAFDTPGPVVCTTTLEAPAILDRGTVGAPVEVTRCGVVRTTFELVTDRYFSWRAPYARGVGVVNQITDLFGIAMGGGREGNRVMGFGFPDQAITWDGSAIENTTASLLDEQSPGLPLRTGDLPSVFGASLADPSRTIPRPVPQGGYTSFSQPVRGLW